ncbi:energy-coupling factor transporter transmembrane component T family protein [Nocardia aurantia]|uniref:Energy-coupling factor transporter transmembrane protein BioN n=1 Tax=Nocardia aurantia TaxID=2585199 RepID=A0A7K0DTP9_9NOCA|nr:energy-coupling factor transporter transmembrane protein EcfT [Nocardia aurantia]MQY29143.1 Energy-coupling factor transporter transmembrane protein BioN [Nocardia aurantia]
MNDGLYVSGTTIPHRLPAGPKFAALFVAGIGLFLVDSLPVAAAAAVVAALILLSCRMPWRTLRARLTPLVWMLGCFFALTAVLQDLHTALLTLSRLLAVLLLALAVTLTTPPIQVLDLFERLAGLLRYVGVRNTERIGLSIALVLRFVPEVHRHFLDIREAQRARGLHANPVALLVPLLVRTLKSADDVAAAVDARCYPPEPAAADRTEEKYS